MSVLLVSDIIRYLFSFVFVVYIARYLGTEGFGLLSFVIASISILGVVIDLGMNSLMVRNVAVDKSLAGKYLGNILLIKIILTILIFGALFSVIVLGSYPLETVEIVLFIGLSVIVTIFTSVFTNIFQSHEKMQYLAIGDIIRSILMLVGAFFIISLNGDVVVVASVYFYANLVVFVYSLFVVLWKFVKPRIEIDLGFWKKIFCDSLPMGGMAICFLIYFRVDTVMLGFMKGDVAVGLYNASYRLIDATMMIPSLVMTVVFPVLSRYHGQGRESFLLVYEKSFKFLLYLGILMAIVVSLLSPLIIDIVYGDAFLESAGALRILIWASTMLFVSSVLGSVLVAAHKQMFGFYVNLATIFINVFLNLMIIPFYGFIGAAVTTVVSEIISLIICLYYLEAHGYPIGLKAVFLPAFLGLGVTGGMIGILSIMGFSSVVIALVSFVLFGGLLFKFGVKKDDMLLIRKVFTREKHNK